MEDFCIDCEFVVEHPECHTLQCDLGVQDGETSCDGVAEYFGCVKFKRAAYNENEEPGTPLKKLDIALEGKDTSC